MEVGAGVTGTFGGEHQASGGRGDREVLHGPEGQVAFLPMATMHMAVWCASALGTEERPSSNDKVSWELGAGPTWKSVSQSDGGGAAGCGGWGRGGSRDEGCEALGGAGAAAGAGAPGSAGGSFACGLARRAAAVMAVEMLRVRIEPSSFRWFNSVYHRWADRGQGAGTWTWGLAGSKTQLRAGQASREPVCWAAQVASQWSRATRATLGLMASSKARRSRRRRKGMVGGRSGEKGEM